MCFLSVFVRVDVVLPLALGPFSSFLFSFPSSFFLLPLSSFHSYAFFFRFSHAVPVLCLALAGLASKNSRAIMPPSDS